MSPTYEYVCPKCKAYQLIAHGFHDTDTFDCPECGDVMQKKISAIPTIFKTGGFYKTGN